MSELVTPAAAPERQRLSPRQVVVTILRNINYLYFAVPIVYWAIMAPLICYDVMTLKKEALEYLGIIVMAVFTAVAFVHCAINRHKFFVWLLAFNANLLCREIHFRGTSTSVFVVLLILAVILLTHYAALQPYIDSRVVVSLLAAGMFTYFLSQTLDQRWWRFIPGEKKYHVPLEESMEVVGHTLVGMTAIFAKAPKPSDPVTP